jgi:hypothetical protein
MRNFPTKLIRCDECHGKTVIGHFDMSGLCEQCAVWLSWEKSRKELKDYMPWAVSLLRRRAKRLGYKI